MQHQLAALNQMSQADFVQALGWVFEHSPWVAERAWANRPFNSVEELHTTMCNVVATASAEEQLGLIRAHPDLATRARISPVSQSEQAGVGLDKLSPAEFERFTDLNERYKSRFGFPFIKAVRGGSKEAILAALEERVQKERDQEFRTAIAEIYKIGRFRLWDTVS